jgi:hypothetical protein
LPRRQVRKEKAARPNKAMPTQNAHLSAAGGVSHVGTSTPSNRFGHFDKFETASSGPTCAPNMSNVPHPPMNHHAALQMRPGHLIF